MANRYASNRHVKLTSSHVKYTRRSRELLRQTDSPPVPAYAERMEPVAATPLTKQAALPLAGFYRLCEAQLRAERKSPKTIKNYKEALYKFKGWFETSYGCQPRMGDLTVVEARLFLAHALEQPKWQGHPLLEGVTKETLSVATVHQYTRGLKTFGAWLEREDYLLAHPLQTLHLPKLDEKQLRPLSEEEERKLLGAYDDNNPTECRLKAIFLLMLDTGLRLTELITPKVENVDLENGFLLVMGKGRKERSIPFGFTTERLLRKYVTFFRPAGVAILPRRLKVLAFAR